MARAVEHYFSLGETLHLYWLSNEIDKLAVENHWEALAREALRDDLEWQQRALTVGLLQLEQLSEHHGNCLDSWLSKQQHMVERWDALLERLKRHKVETTLCLLSLCVS